MRKELILVLLGIISASLISNFLAGYGPTESDKVLLDTVVGGVGAGNFSYWQLGHTGPLLVELTSLSGDADLYVADNIRPSYEVDMNNFSSTTCGPDLVSIPSSFPRPLGIGVFGHWSHSISEYSIQVFLDLAAGDIRDAEKSELANEYPDMESRASARERAPLKDKDGEHRPRFLRLLSVLDMIFEMFVL